MFDKNQDKDDNKKNKIIIEITNLVNDEENFEEDLDEYCEFMKEIFLQSSGLN